jgi:uncharacterized membrane protein
VSALFLLLVSTLLPHSLGAKSYAIPEIRVEVAVQEDGTIHITEHRTYNFDGSFSWADYRLPLEGYTAIKDIRVRENNAAFINQNSEEPGTFQVQRSDKQIRIQWFYKAKDEQRTFSISYTLEGAIVVGPEWVEFFWKYISADRDQDTERLHIEMQLPQSIGSDSIYSWERGPADKITLTNTESGYLVTAKDLNEDETVKIRSVFPRSIFNQQDVTTTNPDFTLAWAQEDEQQFQQRLAEQRERDARYAQYGQQLAILVSLLSICAFLYFYRKYGKRFPVNVSSRETIMTPGRLKPAAAGWLLQGRNINSTHLMATLLDLARRGYFIIKEEEAEEGWFGSKKERFRIEQTNTAPSDELTEWESDLGDFVSEQIAEGNNHINELFSKSSYSSSKWFSSWKDKLDDYCRTKDWYDSQSYKGAYGNAGVQFFLLILAIIATIWAGPVGIISLALTFVFLVGSVAIIRRTAEGERTYRRWKAYREGLKNAKAHSIGSDLLDKHVIYAVAFGLSKNKIETIIEENEPSSSAFVWFMIYPGGGHSSADIASSFSTLAASGTASFPGASSAGSSGASGASAGAAGGGAAGGAG